MSGTSDVRGASSTEPIASVAKLKPNANRGRGMSLPGIPSEPGDRDELVEESREAYRLGTYASPEFLWKPGMVEKTWKFVT